MVSADEPETVRARNGLCSLLDIELKEDMLDVRFDGLGCDAKTSCDFLVRSTLGDQIEDVSLANTECSAIAETVAASGASRFIKRWVLISHSPPQAVATYKVNTERGRNLLTVRTSFLGWI